MAIRFPVTERVGTHRWKCRVCGSHLGFTDSSDTPAPVSNSLEVGPSKVRTCWQHTPTEPVAAEPWDLEASVGTVRVYWDGSEIEVPRMIQVMYRGAVLDDRERNGYDDSDFYAVVWDEAAGTVRTVDYASTRYGGGGSCQIDATEEVREKARAWYRPIVAEHIRKADEAKRAKQASHFRVGDVVRVARGRKVPKGTEGSIRWMGKSYYGGMRVMIVTETGEKFFTAAKNLDHITPADVDPPMSDEDVERLARRCQDGYATAFATPGWAVL